MSNWSRFAGALLMLSTLACTPGWREVSSSQGLFAVSMPGIPTVTTQEASGERWSGQVLMVNSLQGVVASYMPGRTSVTYWARYEDVPEGWDAGQVVDRYIEERERWVSARRQFSRTDVRHLTYDGVELRSEHQGLELVARIFVIGRRSYTLEVMVPTDNFGAAEIDRFMGSFRILD